MKIGHFFGVLRALQKTGNGVHGPGAVEGNNGAQVLHVLGAQAHTHTCHTCGFQLKDSAGPAVGKHFVDLLVPVLHLVQSKVRVLLLDHFHRIVQNSQVPKPQKVHFEKPQLLQGHHGVLGHRLSVVGSQGHIVGDWQPGNDHAGGMGRRVTGHSLNGAGSVDEDFYFFVLLIQVPQRLRYLQRLVQGDVQGHGHLLGHLVHPVVGDAQHPPHVPDSPPGRHSTKGNDLGHMVGAVFLAHVVDDLLTAAGAEINVDIGHSDPGRVQKPLKK